MQKFNIIYTSPGNDIYLWNGAAFDELESDERETLLYSGASVDEDKVDEVIQECREAAKESFPMDANPDIKKIEISVS
jgi:hypothetical protein